jgi:hypothetical protein
MKEVSPRIKYSFFACVFFITILFYLQSPTTVFAALPAAGEIFPTAGSNPPDIPRTYTCTYTDADGWRNIKETYLLINTTPTSFTNTVYLYYDQNTNLLYLRNDANTSWLGGYAPGTANIIENSQVKLNCSSSTVVGTSTKITVYFGVTFKPLYSGKTYNIYLRVKDDTGGLCSWTKKGTYTVNNPPKTCAITPSQSAVQANVEQVFTTTCSDSDGWQNIQYVYFLVNSSTNLTNCFYGYYNQDTNKLYLRNDANTAWVGGYSPGANYIIENTYCKLNCSKTSISGSGNTLNINWDTVFKSAFNGLKNTYLYVKDDTGAYEGWILKGTVNIDTIAPTGSIKINNDNGWTNSTQVLLNLSAQDNTGGSNVSKMQFSNDNVTWSQEEAYADSKNWAINSGDGTKSVYARFKDAAGNLSVVYSDTIILDTVCPDVIITEPADGVIVDDPNITLKGTVDGVSFSESRVLDKEGENIVKKTAQDSAGNTKEVSIKVYYYKGCVIGVSGGEIVSLDGKVKIIIPQGALSQNVKITILPIKPDVLNEAAPLNKTLLSVVECKPYGLVFNKPVSLVYTLSQAEVPGTILELGLYDSAQEKIIPTGQNSAVSSDGYTLKFLLVHFSTYAALKSTDQQASPINASVKIPLPDMLTGAFGCSIPITVSPGRKGVQPGIGLRYSSSNSNSWVGVGFSLNSGYIVRSTRLGPPTYTDNDTFYFITDSGTVELVKLVDNLYQAKIESSFAKFFKETDDSWRVLNKDGTVLLFGKTTDSKEISTQGAYSWHLTKVQDTNGNYVEYQYTKDEGKSYIYRINYTGNSNGITPKNSVEFILESRDDASSSYISSARIATAKRLKEIQVKVNSELVWKYVLGYEYSADTNRSLLRSIRQYGSDGKSMPEQGFGYQKAK